MATEEKEISSIVEDMSLLDKDYENNKTGEINEPELFDSEPLMLDKEYDPENSKNSNNDEIQKQVFSLKKIKEKIKVSARQETVKIDDIVKEHEHEIKSLYEEEISLNKNMLDFQKNKNQMQYEIMQQQKELIKKYEKEIEELKNLNQQYSKNITKLKEVYSDLKNKEEEIKHYQNDNLRLGNKLFEASKKLENTKERINKFENDKFKIQEQIDNLNKIISQNKDVQNISKITIKEKPDVELDIKNEPDIKLPNIKLDESSENSEEKNKTIHEVNLKTKNIFGN